MTPVGLMLGALFAASGVLFVLTGRAPLRYGRHAPPDARGVPIRLAWILIALPGLVLCPWTVYDAGGGGVVPLIMLALWMLAYGWRGILYPALIRGTHRKRMPWTAVVLGAALTATLAYLNGLVIAETWRAYPLRWLWSIRFLYGVMLFVAGMLISRAADLSLINLRSRGDVGHVLPRGVFFEEVSCPNYLGEMLMWIGWAVLTWSKPGLASATLAVALLLPRAVSHHLWYRRTFPNLPPNRRAVIPFVL